MDGAALLYNLRQVLNEASDSGFLDNRTSYEYLWRAAIEFTERTSCLTTTQSITTIANTQNYTLNADYLRMYLRNQDYNYYIKYNDGSANTFPLFKEKEEIIFQNSTASVSNPYSWYIEDDTLAARVSSTTTAASTASGGEATLTDSTAPFANVNAGDIVNNTTTSAAGYVLSKTSSSVLVTTLFGGTNQNYGNGDSYVIQPAGRKRLVLQPPPSTAGHTITFYYVQRPAPVFSSYGMYRFGTENLQAIIFYAAWLYKYRDRDPNYGDRFFKYFEDQTRKNSVDVNRSFNRTDFKVNLKARR